MSLLISNEIFSAVKIELASANDSVQMITAFCTEESLRIASKSIRDGVRKRLLVRFRLDDLLLGGTDFSILEYCQRNGWDAYIRFDLHAKTYVVDSKRGITGSANLTGRGMTCGEDANYEMAALVDITPDDIAKIDSLFREAIQVTQELIDQLRVEYEAALGDTEKRTRNWSAEINRLFRPRVSALFSFEFPANEHYSKGDWISFLDIEFNDNSLEVVKRLRWCRSYQWLVQTLEKNSGELYFGELSSILHGALIEDPKPYRCDVKMFLGNMLNFVVDFQCQEIAIDRPRYSQRVRLV